VSSPSITVLGLGYVGLPLAVALAEHFQVTGLDTNEQRIAELSAGRDRTGEISAERLAATTLRLTSDAAQAASADIYIVTVPTPVDTANRPDLGPLLSATATVASLLEPGRTATVVYESTVYPGVTEDVCGPEIERLTGLRAGQDFHLGYSPERINPGDVDHRIDTITKVVAASGSQTLDLLTQVYGAVNGGNIFRAASIKAAEAAKVIENAQRDINIAFMNELAQIFSKLDLSIWDVLDAARTKWNFLPFEPGLVGGHCIGVDPYYLAHKAQEVGHWPQIVLSGRETNDGMGAWIADRLHERLGSKDGTVLVLGLTFKENVPDLRNSRVIDIVRRLQWLGHKVEVADPMADPEEARREYQVELVELGPRRYDAIVGAVAHEQYRALTPDDLIGLVREGGLVADVKRIWSLPQGNTAFSYWSL
jgi:UDP-N-acetyl-D-galactosamine dehydrogenase